MDGAKQEVTTRWRDEDPAVTRATDLTRRDAVKVGGGSALAALAMVGLGGRLAAQDSTPVAGDGLEGRYVVVRIRGLKPGASAAELVDLVREGFEPLVRKIPGFVSYAVVADEETRQQFAVSVFADKAGADESNRLAAEWGPEAGAFDFTEGDPVVAEGTIAIAAEAGA